MTERSEMHIRTYHVISAHKGMRLSLHPRFGSGKGGLDDVTDALTALKEGLGEMPDPGAVLRHDRFGRVLCQVNSTRLIALISTAAMETDAGEASDAACCYDHGLPRIVAEVADHVVGLLVFDMLDWFARARSRVRQE